MSNLIKFKINVSKIDKNALFRGEKGVYLDAVLIPTPNSRFNQDYMVKQDLGREARERGEEGAIIGGGTILHRKADTRAADSPQPPTEAHDHAPEDDDMPF